MPIFAPTVSSRSIQTDLLRISPTFN
jgi:hypothetical protein